jgi:hypothetical protein
MVRKGFRIGRGFKEQIEVQRWPKAEMEMVACMSRDGAEMVGKEQRWWPGLEQIIEIAMKRIRGTENACSRNGKEKMDLRNVAEMATKAPLSSDIFEQRSKEQR